MKPPFQSDAHQLLDEARTMSLLVTLDVRKTTALIGQLRERANQAHATGLTGIEQQLRQAADELEERLLAG